jgi:Uma2 family endonuclease
MSARIEATVEDLYRAKGKAELIEGEVVQMSPAGGLPNYAANEITFSLRQYSRRTGTGHAVGDNAAFVVNLASRRSFSPDAAFYFGDITMGFFEGAPVFAVEVRSEGDHGPRAERAMAEKRADYFAAGTSVVWDVDLLTPDVIKKYCADDPDQSEVFRRGDVANAEPALPGWTMRVDDLFAS